MKLLKLPESLTTFYDDDSLVYYDDETFYYNHKVDEDLVSDIENKELFLITGYYTPTIPEWKKKYEAHKPENKPTLHLIGKGKKSGKVSVKVENFLPYCYIDDEFGEYKTYLKKPVEKIYFECNPTVVGMYRKACEEKNMQQPYEADVLFIDRFYIDCGEYFKPKEVPELNVGIFDIETNFPVDNSIISFSINDGSSVYHNSIHRVTHRELIQDLWDRLKTFDVITGWNVEFDTKHTENEVRKLIGDKSYRLHHDVGIIDMMMITRRMWAKEIKGSWSLDNAGYRIAGEKKVKIDKHPRELPPDELEKYNNRDVVLPKIIDDITGGLECFFTTAWMSHTRLENTDLVTKINDIELLNVYHKAGIVLNSKPPYSQKPTGTEAQYAAADPQAKPGIYDNIMSFDLKHAYPWASRAINATAETIDPKGKYVAPNGVRFNDGESVFINALEHIMDERSKAKKQMYYYLDKGNEKLYKKYKYIDFALKTQAAAFSHGEFGYWRSRMRNYDAAEAITQTAKGVIFHTMKILSFLGFPWVYEHTDSAYVICPKERKEELIDLVNSIVNEYCTEQGYKVPAELEYEDFYPVGYIHSPARKVLVPEGVDITNNDDWLVTGMNFMRSETPEVLADIEEHLVMMSLQKKPTSDLMKYLIDRVKTIDKYPDHELGLVKPYNKKISDYGKKKKDGTKGSIPYHIKAYIKAHEEYGLDLNVGEKFMILPIITKEWSGVNVVKRSKVEIAFPLDSELPDQYKIDYEKYLEANLFGKIYGLFNMTKKDLFIEIRKYIPNINEADEIVEKAKQEVARQKKIEKFKRERLKEIKKKEKAALKKIKK